MKKVTLSGDRTWAPDSKSNTILSELTGHLLVRLSLWDSYIVMLYSSKIQVVHEQKFKDPLSSTCQISPERRVLDLKSEVNQRSRSIPTSGNIFPKFYNPNLHNIARFYRIGFKMKKPG